eukprot:4194663-Prymnesium_polylepis.1
MWPFDFALPLASRRAGGAPGARGAWWRGAGPAAAWCGCAVPMAHGKAAGSRAGRPAPRGGTAQNLNGNPSARGGPDCALWSARACADLAAVGSLHGFTVQIRCETARNSCETAAKRARHT